jgi:3-hydroxyisobutyrate dehydrogenase-like beta-hydroxyacid dehydrogenase
MPDSNSPLSPPRVALVGFGEAGEAFVRAPAWRGETRAWDLLPERRAAMEACGVTSAPNAREALADAEIVLSLVTADQALIAALDYACHLAPGAIWCDMNSVAPDTKRQAAQAVAAANAYYVDVAVMAPVERQLDVPLLLAGRQVERAKDMLAQIGFSDLDVVANLEGSASAIKMIRSVMVKGLEALSWECAAAADSAGVFWEVMDSLDASEKPISWAERIAYNRERMRTHGLRRAAEMEEACKTLVDLGVEPVMSQGTVKLQRRAGEAARVGKDQAA